MVCNKHLPLKSTVLVNSVYASIYISPSPPTLTFAQKTLNQMEDTIFSKVV